MATQLSAEALWALAQRSGSAAQPGTLHVLATPIGNLGDVTLRCARLLDEVDTLYCEDTRVTAKLLQALGLRTAMVSLNEHNEAARVQTVLDQLRAGHKLGLVSDAGTPLLSDPGARLVQAVVEADLPVTVAPGASAALTAVVGSGLPVAPSVFLGFAERKKGKLAEQLAPFADADCTLLLFEAPGRVEGLLKRLADLLGDRPVVVARELTKRHETFHRGRLGEALHDAWRGEVVVVVGPPEQGRVELEGEALDAEVRQLLGQGHRPKAVALLLAARAPRRLVYARAVALASCSDGGGSTD